MDWHGHECRRRQDCKTRRPLQEDAGETDGATATQMQGFFQGCQGARDMILADFRASFRADLPAGIIQSESGLWQISGRSSSHISERISGRLSGPTSWRILEPISNRSSGPTCRGISRPGRFPVEFLAGVPGRFPVESLGRFSDRFSDRFPRALPGLAQRACHVKGMALDGCILSSLDGWTIPMEQPPTIPMFILTPCTRAGNQWWCRREGVSGSIAQPTHPRQWLEGKGLRRDCMRS